MPDFLFTEGLDASLNLAVKCLKESGIVAFPTETFYGLAVDPDSPEAINNLFKIKKRQADKPLLLLVENRDQLLTIAEDIPSEYVSLMDKYWPGPLTLIFPAQKHVSRQLSGNSGTIGVRISSNSVATELVRRMGKPITATSANISGGQSPRTAREVSSVFGDRLCHIVDGGPTPGGLSSTVLGLLAGKCTVFRRGCIEFPGDTF